MKTRPLVWYRSIFIQIFVVGSETHSRSFKVIDFGTYRQRLYTFLLVINGNFSPILQFAPFRRYGSLKFENHKFFPPHPHLTPSLAVTQWEFEIKLIINKVGSLPYHTVKELIQITGVTHKRMDGIAIAYR